MAAILDQVGASPAAFQTAQPVNLTVPSQASQMPEFIPLPREGQVEFYSGLRRGALNLLILPCKENNFRPPVQSISLCRSPHTKGKRLIVLTSLLAHLRGLVAKQNTSSIKSLETRGTDRTA
jgi:hypothetical protein